MKKCLSLAFLLCVFVQSYAKIPNGLTLPELVAYRTGLKEHIQFSVSSTLAVDTDSDGVDDLTDQDDDNDGILDMAEAVGGNNPVGDADGDGIPNYMDVVQGLGSGDGSQTDYTDSNGNGIPDVYDIDGDGLANHLDLDSDNDGIPDNIEAQTTLGYLVPNTDNAATYIANHGLNSAYTIGGGYSREGILPIDTDGDAPENRPDYLDTNSDNEGEIDTKEAGFVVASSSSDVDHDGLLDAYERGTPNDGYVPNDGITNPSVIFTDSDSDVNSGGDVNYRDDVNDSPGIMCGPVSTLYQTVGNSSTGKSEVYRYNPFLQQYLKVGELEGASNSSASNSAYNAVTQYVYSYDNGGKTLRVYDPADDFTFVGEITITGTTQNFNNVLFAQDNLLGFIVNNRIIKFDVSAITSYPATVSVTEIPVTGTFSSAADYALLGDYVYGASNASPARLVKVHVNTGVSVRFDLTLANNTTNNDALGTTYGAAWQDRFGNFYTFNNTNGDIYKITDVANATNGTALTKILLAAPSGQNDGFGCELNPDPLDWDGDTYSDDIDLDDDNDGILDTDEDANTDGDDDPLTEFTDTDGDNIPDAYDLDSDGDGIPDNVEAQTTAGYIAPSGIYTNGLDNAYVGGLTPINTDAAFPNSDLIPDYLDVDSDNDGIYDVVEANLVLSGRDYDGDGLDNNIDTVVGLDDPNGIVNDPGALPNSDGINDIDVRDARDSDGDGIQDVSDDDDDNDGIPDTEEVSGGYDPLGDADRDGAPNFADVSQGVGSGDGSSTDYTDSNSNGVPDVFDVDGDGIVNHLDLDSDNDGIYDAVEAAHGQAQTGGRVNGSVGADGLPDVVQNADNDPINYILADSETTPDGTADFLERDADGDGCNDVREAGFTDDDDNGFPGAGTFGAGLLVNINGVVTSGSDGYTTPNANYTNDAVKIACNRAPTSANKTLSASEDTPLLVSAADLGYNDPDGDVLSKITINTVPAPGTLFLDADTDGIVDAGEALSDNDEITKAQLDAGLLKFLSAEHGNGTGYTAFTFTVNDSFTDAVSSSTITFDVAAVNDAPTSANKTLTSDEDVVLTIAATDLGYADVDNDALGKITIPQIPTTGTLFLDADDDGVIDASEILSNTDEVSKADLDASRLKYLPAANGNGAAYASFNFIVNDGTADAASFSTITFNITAINNAPTADNESVTTDEDTGYTFTAGDFSAHYGDIENDAFDGIRITGLPTAGSLKLAGVDIVLNDEISLSDFTNGDLVFTPAANQHGAPYATFTFQVKDDGDAFSTDYTLTVNVTAVGDAPISADHTISTDEDMAYTFANPDFSFSDVSDVDNFASVIISSLPAQGTLYYNGVAVSQMDVTSETAFADRTLFSFTAEENANGTAYTSFGFKVLDDAGDVSVLHTITVDVNAVNDAPTLSMVNKPAAQAKVTNFSAADFTDQFSDVEGDVLTKIQIVSLPDDGTLQLNGVDVVLNDEIAIADLSNLTFTPHAVFTGTTTFGWKAFDGTAYSVSAAQVSMNVVPQQSPVLTNSPKAGQEDESLAFAATDFSSHFSDGDGDPLTKIQITTLPDHGTLYLNGVVINANTEIAVADLDLLTFVPDADFNGSTSFIWKAHDGFQYSDVDAKVELTVSAVQDKPVVGEVPKTGKEDEEITFSATDFPAHFSDADGESLAKIQIISLPENGTLLLNGVVVAVNDEIPAAQLNQLVFSPDENYSGTTSFSWKGSDGTDYAENTATVNIEVEAVADGVPVATPATFEMDEGATLSQGALAVYVTDPEGSGISFSTVPVVAPAHGTLVLHSDGTFTYTPQAGYVGEDSFTYEVCDHSTPAQCISGTVKISVGKENPADSDSDQDGIPDAVEIGSDPAHPLDTDGDGTPDFQDTDSDNDGIPDSREAGSQPEHPVDTDGDGVPDTLDTDSDGDGITDHAEAGTDPAHPVDSDNDGIPDYLETDSDDDGIPDAVEVGAHAAQPRDTDGDGIPDFQDKDSDNDGIPDAIEFGNNPAQPLDTDGDGIPDYQDTDSDGDGLPDSFEAGANPEQPVDTDKDGIPDMREVDSDNDGVPDATEVGSDPNHPRDLDGDGIPDFQETDSDGDGIADNEEDVIVIYKGFSPNNDGKNELWLIDGIENYPDNTVQIFNRWGNKVYEVKGYNNRDRAWSSESSLGLVLGDAQVPDGTYFYIIDLKDGKQARKGYITVHR
ncbi:tandem-95 repeat protein [Catalinimonas niigatensis]|uniref:tandem-95 repeat protein n=1 Tax=Catalinimonas niigatensis TaxID=1397264 RepID=UPI0026665155|nr:tandem-95 repeat protein [Catalinimonas niigatensis]WPP49752.1 tandem-95 repeat protein [Catalinimonas niigatensis]